MSPTLFNKLLWMVGPSLFKKDTNMRRSIPVEQRLALTLRCLASGDCMRSLSYSFRIGHSTVSKIVNETCRIMYEILAPTYLQLPDTNMWKLISNDFSKIWNFPNCVGAGDGKHFAMQCPNNGGSYWYNYKGFHSMVMFAVCDANYCFIAVDIGAYGREGDARPSKLVYSDSLSPYVFVMDDAFPLKKNIMKPYPGRSTGSLTKEELIFNYRLSRARRTIENAFGIVTNKLRIFRKPMIGSPQNVENYIKAGVVLHNMLIREDSRFYLITKKLPDHFDVNGVLIEGAWRTDNTMTSMFRDLRPGKGINYPTVAKNIRDQFTKYFSNEGAVPWQRVIVEDTGRISEEEG
ncbi:protein ANTAGONIST OF LIKE HETEROCHROMATIN PROTEIN 1-like isoform X2 [Daphnia magna]|uniref:protein ANTAGONIST OF LIKE HETEROCHROMATIN PROTEIN 1-like isoform X2 n=1 Tax=Daphnia magna TaxID=35525 RepID=UPI001E1BD41F|nr:protein ANTAGONIST OF LIKE HETEROCHROMATIN PROTEIN 1-like isoform X2 [Daphnia magna]